MFIIDGITFDIIKKEWLEIGKYLFDIKPDIPHELDEKYVYFINNHDSFNFATLKIDQEFIQIPIYHGKY